VPELVFSSDELHAVPKTKSATIAALACMSLTDFSENSSITSPLGRQQSKPRAKAF
jgi:hypothetical protein